MRLAALSLLLARRRIASANPPGDAIGKAQAPPPAAPPPAPTLFDSLSPRGGAVMTEAEFRALAAPLDLG